MALSFSYQVNDLNQGMHIGIRAAQPEKDELAHWLFLAKKLLPVRL